MNPYLLRLLLTSALLWLAAPAAIAADTATAAAEPPLRSVAEIVGGRCALCHGANGESASAIYPRLAAQHPEYLAKQLRDFRDGRRKSDTMSDMARDLRDEEITALAAFFSSKPAAARQRGDQELAAVGRYLFTKGNRWSGVPACTSCHGADGHGTAELPRLAGQHPAYIETQLKDFNERQRNNDNAIMHSIAAKLTEMEVNALSIYIGSLQ
ncbi:Cytochrome c4 [Sterolibacterium denitrificans]|nr:c-type cytochrome [Sterolibacterium denitrificans]SMB29241.1 Cytochrome c4 [Sterolibacterium denitrificans]